ncbi:MAG: hypothetical protein J6Q13_02130, partial [Clostridia bacterium]|nr:hypothetical protein [Clostridia bacterium]
MNIKKKTIKTILGTTTACSALMLGGIGAIDMLKPKYEIFATGVDRISVTISNANFDESKKSSYPYSPSSYTAYNQGKKVDSSSEVKANVKAGVINLSNEDYATRFALAKRDSLDDYVLMIDSKDENSDSYHSVNYGFQTNSTTKLEANSKYMFTVDVFNLTNTSGAKLYLFDSNGEVFSSINSINSYNQWTTYTFFVATNNYSSFELKIGMYLEGKGTVLFDNLSCQKLSDSFYDLSKESYSEGTFAENNKIDNIVKTFYINNDGKLECAEVETAGVSTTYHSSNLTHKDYEVGKKSTLDKAEDSDGFNKNALLLTNEDKTYSQYETDSIFTFEQNRIYKVSVNVKTKDLNGTATLELIRTDIEEDDENYKADKHNKTISITSNTYSTTSSVTNDYKTYSFLINSSSNKDLTYKLRFGLGTKDSLTTGSMYLSEIEVSKIDYETFNSASTGSGVEKIDHVKVYGKDSKIMLQNGDFNGFKIADYNSPMPATPIDWEVSIGKNTQKYGVVNTKTFAEDLKDLNLSNLSNPSSENNNVLMMYNETADTLSYKSTSKTLAEKTYHKFEVSVQTQNAPLTVSLVSKKDDNEIILASKTVSTNGTWEPVSLYIFTGYQSVDVSLKLTLNTATYGYAYIDDAKFDYALTTAELEQEFKSAGNTTYTAVADMSKLMSSETNEKFAKSQFFKTEEVSSVDSGILTVNATYLDEVVNNLTNFNSIASKGVDKVFAISTMYDTNYTATSNIGFKLLTGTDKYYKLTVDVYTQGISANDNETNTDLIGAGIKLSGYDNSFTSIISDNE